MTVKVARGSLLGVLALLLAGCAGSASSAPTSAAPASSAPASSAPASAAPGDPVEQALDDVAKIHGAPGPWAVSGWRMARYALASLRLPPGSFDLEIVHYAPKKVQYSCIADGAAAYSGASLGKLNLSLASATDEGVITVYRNRRSGESLALRPSPAFRERFLDADRSKARELGREVMMLPDDQVFERTAVPTP